MNKILELREKRARLWETAKNFLDSKRGADGLVSAEDAAAYDKMEADMVALGKEIDRLERQAAHDRELAQATSDPITGTPGAEDEPEKTGQGLGRPRSTSEYKKAFWAMLRTRGNEGLDAVIKNALRIGSDPEGVTR